jgi:hypothetical protein
MSILCICHLPVCSCNEDIPNHQLEIMEACETGRVSVLQSLLDATGVEMGDNASQRTLDHISPSGAPAAIDMIYSAVTHNQHNVLRLLLDYYPSANVSQVGLLVSEGANPDLSTLKVLHSHDPSIVNYALDEKGLEILLEHYCRSGKHELPEYLLDNGADPNGAGHPSLMNPLKIAIMSDQPPSLISKLIQRGAYVDTIHVMYAMRHQRTDITAMLRRKCQWNADETPNESLDTALEDAYLTKDKEMISLIKNYMDGGRVKKQWWRIWN